MVKRKIVTYLILIVVLFSATIRIVRVVTEDKTKRQGGGNREHFIVVPTAKNHYREQERERLIEKQKSEGGTTSTGVKPKDLTTKLVQRVSRRIYDLTDTNYKYSDGFLLNQCEILHNRYKNMVESQREIEKSLSDFGKNSVAGTPEEPKLSTPKKWRGGGGGNNNNDNDKCNYNLTDTQLTRLQRLESRLEDFDNRVFKEDGLWPNYQEKRKFRNASIKISEL